MESLNKLGIDVDNIKEPNVRQGIIPRSPFVYILVVLVIISALLFKLKIPNLFNTGKTQALSANILYITSPVTTLSGKITSIHSNVLVLNIQKPATQGSNSNNNSVNYTINISPKTSITQISNDGTVKVLTLNDLQVGRYVKITSNQDLRTLPDSSFTAVEINVPPIRTSFVGYVNTISGNMLTVMADIPPIVPTPDTTSVIPAQKSYTVTTTAATNISFSYASGTPDAFPTVKNVSLSDIIIHAPITVYTNNDIDITTNVVATRITEFLGPPAPTASVSAAGSK